ncbi:hypothetical protein E2P81_ATG05254 [Venturia nashicola]|nr:hypothetical protein E2P81_ATG05254 [Venturia nashicola]
MDRPANSRRPNEEDNQDARVGILIQTDLQARNAIATRSSTNGQPRDTATPQTTIPPQSFNDKFPLYLAKLDTLVSQTNLHHPKNSRITKEAHLATTNRNIPINNKPIPHPHTPTPPQITSLGTIQQLLKETPNLNIPPHILSQTITQIPIPILKTTHQSRLTLDSSLSLLLQLDFVLRGDKAYEGNNDARENGFLDWIK